MSNELQQLYEEEDVEGLRRALAEASSQAQKGSKTIADFSQKLARAESRQASRRELQEAHRAGEARRLAAALQAAEDAGIAEAELGPARQALLQAREREQDAATRNRAAEELRRAVSSDDAGRVEKALAAAEAAGLGGPEAAHARERLRQMRGRTGAERELSEATSSGDVYRIRAALATARQSGVGEKEMRQAQGELQRLKDQAHARRGLEAAVASADAEFLRRCIEEAKRVGISRQEIARAETAARELCQTQVGSELSQAVASGSLERLRAAARAAADAGVSGAEVDAAWERIRELEAHDWLRRQLAAAAASGDAARLQAAIKQADAGGLGAAEVATARARLDACHAQLHAQQEQRLARAGGAEPSAAADKAAPTVPGTVYGGGALAGAPTPIANAMRQCALWAQAPATVLQQPQQPSSGVGQQLQPHPPVAPHRAPSMDSVVTAPREPTAAPGADRRRAVRWA
ncbi:unnamed protein product [Prorocentrum cordatum]|uniref:Uncharacterized protein n=1 Tax=Prorocentrum cordatum TaxID=2364126 RepID=A0ABN9UJE1_9DINO|nr:unnamed protein product [Polarella glacialis]